MRDESPPNFQKISCLCGAEVRVDPMNRERRVTCPSCQSKFDFVVTMDPNRKNSRLSLILPRAALQREHEPRAEAPAPPSPPAKAVTRVTKKASSKTLRASMAQCECGASFPLEDTGELTTLQSCPQCNRIYHVVFKIESGTKLKTAIIVPQRPIVHRGERIRTMAVSPSSRSATQTGKPAGAGPAEPLVSGKKGRTRAVTRASRMTSPARSKPAPEIPAGAQAVPCSCGEIFAVRRKDLGQKMSCGGCGRRVSFEESRDPQTLAPLIRIRGKSKF